eukprot:9639619-Alexandrium_andersonii.AAC.1
MAEQGQPSTRACTSELHSQRSVGADLHTANCDVYIGMRFPMGPTTKRTDTTQPCEKQSAANTDVLRCLVGKVPCHYWHAYSQLG